MKLVKRSSVLLIAAIALVVLVTLIAQYSTEAQFPGGGGGPGGNRAGGGAPGGRPGGFDMKSMIMNSLESSWAYISFEMELDDAMMPKVRKVFKEQWDAQKKMAEEMGDSAGGGDPMQAMQEMNSEVDKLKEKRNGKLKDILSTEEMEKFTKWEKAQSQTQRRRRS